MAGIKTVVLADGLLASAGLRAWCCGILALPRTMAELLAVVDATFQLLAAWQSATYFGEPTRLIL